MRERDVNVFRPFYVADDEWCADCGESLPCGCADYDEEEDTEGEDA